MKSWKFIVMLAVLAVSGFAGGLVSGLVFKAQPVKADAVPDQLLAKDLVIVDKSGNPRLMLSTDDEDNTPLLMLLDKKANPRLILGMSELDEPIFSLTDKAGKLRGMFTTLDQEGAALELYDAKENSIWAAP